MVQAGGPVAAPRTWYRHDPDRFEEFARRYRHELTDPARAEALAHLRRMATHQTLRLLTATKDVSTSEADVLAALVR